MTDTASPLRKTVVVPPPLVRAALTRPVTSQLVVPSCGWVRRTSVDVNRRRVGADVAYAILCTDGRGWCEVDQQEVPVEVGDVILIPPGVPYAYGHDPDDPWTCWWLHVDGSALTSLLEANDAADGPRVRRTEDSHRTLAIIEEIIRVLDLDATYGSMLAAGGAAWHLLASLAGRPGRGSETPSVDRAVEYLRDNLAEPVTVKGLARLVNLSPSHFAVVFRRRFGMSVMRYHTHLRMARARELLDMTDRSIGLIGQEVGYGLPAYFSRQFGAIHGMTPRQYRALPKG